MDVMDVMDVDVELTRHRLSNVHVMLQSSASITSRLAQAKEAVRLSATVTERSCGHTLTSHSVSRLRGTGMMLRTRLQNQIN
jgi:hypothetical protein